METELSVITVNYNGYEDTCALIDTIAPDDTVEVIVVDNGSTRDEAALIAQRYPQVRTIRSQQNLGFAGGNNLGLHAATGRYLYLVNNDTLLSHPGSAPQPSDVRRHLKALQERLDSDDSIAMVCPKIRFAWSDCPIQFAGFTSLSAVTLRNRSIGYGETDNGQYDTPHPTPYAHGAAMMIKRDAYEAVGDMPECYFLYYEELDWSLMMSRKGYTIWYEPSATIFHKESRSTGIDSPLKTYYVTRNRLLFARRNIKWPQRLATYCYLVAGVAVRDVAKNQLRRRTDLVRATLLGLYGFCSRKYRYKP